MFRRVAGRPVLPRMDLAAQRRWMMLRCQRRIVSGVTSSRKPWRRALGITLSRAASRARSAQVTFGRPGCRRCSTASWWRRIKISAVFHASLRRDSRSHAAARVIRRKTNRRHMIGDHHGRTAGRASLLLRAMDEILGTHRWRKRCMGRATSPPWPDARFRCQHVRIRATPAWAHASTSPPSTRYCRPQTAAGLAWIAGTPGSGSACANPADGWPAPMTHPASTPKHTTKKPTTPSSSCSSTRTRDGATPTNAPSDGRQAVGFESPGVGDSQVDSGARERRWSMVLGGA